MSTKINPAHALLEGWLAEGRLNSRFADFVESQRIRPDDAVRKARIRGGEEGFRNYFSSNRTADFGAALEPVATGMLNLAARDADATTIEVVKPLHWFPALAHARSVSPLIKVNNKPGIDPWGSSVLGLRAVTLQVGEDYAGKPCGQLCLVLPLRVTFSHSHSFEPPNERDILVVAIELTGHATCFSLQMRVANPLEYFMGGTTDAVDVRQRLELASDDNLGFSGAIGRLADLMPQLGPHIASL